MVTRILLIVIGLMLLSCTPQEKEFTSAEKESIRQEVKNMLLDYNAAIKSKGLSAEFQFLDSSKDFYWFPPGFKTWLGYDSIRAIISSNAPKLRSVINTYDSLRIDPISAEFATYSGILHSKMQDTSGMITEMRLKETGTVIKRGNQWKLLSGQTDILPNQ